MTRVDEGLQFGDGVGVRRLGGQPFIASPGTGVSVFVGFWDDADQFASPDDGGLTAVPPDAWLVDPDDGADEALADHILPGDYGDLLADAHHVIFDRHGFRELWPPGGFEVSRDQRSFRRKTRKGHAVDYDNDVEISCVLDDRNLAHRFAAEGHLVVSGSSATGLIIGCSLQDWHRANRR